MRQAPRSGERRRDHDRLKRASLLPAHVEIMLAVGDTSEARRPAGSSRGSPRRTTAGCWVPWRRTPGERSSSLRATRRPRWLSTAYPRPGRRGRSSKCRTRPPGVRSLYRAPAARWGMPTRLALELEAARSAFVAAWVRPPISPALESLVAAEAPVYPRPTGVRARGAAPCRGREEQPRDRDGARDQRAHRRPPPAEHLREAGAVVANGGRARSPTSTISSERLGPWSEMTRASLLEVGLDPGRCAPGPPRPLAVIVVSYDELLNSRLGRRSELRAAHRADDARRADTRRDPLSAERRLVGWPVSRPLVLEGGERSAAWDHSTAGSSAAARTGRPS